MPLLNYLCLNCISKFVIFSEFLEFNYILVHHKEGHLQSYWCMHSILPVAPRAKQPAIHFHTQQKALHQAVAATIRH
jgi:hypothetical protein